MTEIRLTYVTVKESTPDTVVYTQTAGYSGEYVAATGVLMFGAGLLTAANRATPLGTVSGGRVYNPYTGASAAGGRVSTAYGSAGRAASPTKSPSSPHSTVQTARQTNLRHAFASRPPSIS
jgi:hypothetical protein